MTGPAGTPLYDDFAAAYDIMIDWPKRLSNEAPFFRRLFDRVDVKRVLDVACGTGRHARLFASWGLEVVAVDASAAMIEEARRAIQEGDGPGSAPGSLEWHVADFLSVGDVVGGPFDAVVCIGNSLPHLASLPEVDRALAGFAGLTRPGGALIVQNRNADLMYLKEHEIIGPSSRTVDRTEYVFVRLYDMEPRRMRLTIVTLVKRSGRWSATADRATLLPLFSRELVESVRRAGFAGVQTCGGYDASPYEPDRSDDLIIIAIRG